MIKSSKVFKILRTFSIEEHKEFGRFLDSPYFVSRGKLKELYVILLKQGRHKNFRNVDASVIYRKLFPDEYKLKGYSDSTMRFLFNALYHAAEEFIAVNSFRKKKLVKNEILREDLFKKGLYDEFELNLSKAEELLKDSAQTDTSVYNLRFNIEQDRFNIYAILQGQRIRKRKKGNPEHIFLASKNLFKYFLTENISIVETYIKFCRQKNLPVNQDYVDAVYNSIDIDKAMDFLKGDGNEKTDVMDVFLAKYKAFSNMENDTYYSDFKKILISRSNDMDVDSKYHFFNRLLDYCVIKRRTNPDSPKYGKELISVYKLIIENGFYRHPKSKNLPMDLFRNVILAGLREGEAEWVEEFVEKYKSKLHKDLRKDAVYYAKAKLALENKYFKEALLNIGKIQNDYYQYSVEKKAIYIMASYELHDLEEVLKSLDSFRHYLDNSDHIPARIKNNQKKFVYYVGKLIKEKSKLGKDSDGYLRKQIYNEKDIYSKDWLLKKADELIPRKSNKSSSNRHKRTSFSI